MGSKKAILPFVARELIRLTKPGDIIVDMMAGTHTIGYAMRDRCKLVANDIQRFSRVIGETLLNYYPDPRFEGQPKEMLKRFFQQNMRNLTELFNIGFRQEQRMLESEPSRRVSWAGYKDFCEAYPYSNCPTHKPGWPEDFAMLFSNRRIEAYRTLNKLEPYSLFSLYYANTYVGVRQAAEIDSIRCAIDKLCDSWLAEHTEYAYDNYRLRCLLLCALINVINRINPGPGHWAAYPRVSQKNFEWLISQRSLSVWDMFIAKISDYEDEIAKRSVEYAPHIVMTEDYVKFLQEVHEYIRKARVVYLDPPYSQGHYSRFYHLIETLIQYDYPDIGHTGRYRSDRHQSPFAHKAKVAEAIGLVCEIAREGAAALVISYSQGGVIADADEFRAILEKYFPANKIELRSLDSVHSKLGKAQRMKTVEYLFTCYP